MVQVLHIYCKNSKFQKLETLNVPDGEDGVVEHVHGGAAVLPRIAVDAVGVEAEAVRVGVDENWAIIQSANPII